MLHPRRTDSWFAYGVVGVVLWLVAAGARRAGRQAEPAPEPLLVALGLLTLACFAVGVVLWLRRRAAKGG